MTGASASPPERAAAAAVYLRGSLREKRPFDNLPPELAPAGVDEAYDAQEALHALFAADYGRIVGLKIATTTKVMQALMGIDHPCGGAIFEKRVHASPATLDPASYVSLKLECEIAVRLGRDLSGDAVSTEEARAAVDAVAPAFELIDDRSAVYRETKATSLIAENSWNAGVVLGAWRPFAASDAVELAEGTLSFDGVEQARGRADDPFGALAWLARLAARRRRPLRKGMLVITGSLVPTFAPPAGAQMTFALEGWGEARARLV